MNRICKTIRDKLIEKVGRLTLSEDGGALAELAIMVPFLAIMLAGVSEFGRFFRTYNTLDKATRSASRYLSSHNLTQLEIDRATSLVVCGKLACAGGDELVTGISASNVCLESSGSPKVITVTARIPRTNGDCNPMVNAPANPVPFVYQPIFNIGALIGSNTFTLALPISPGTTMYYIINN
jgi:TadE-like protein